ncbi:hypothetical protein FoTM2_004346 [Fusarium oxysporum f. sp. vasinfectum]|nr:hypothetical protein FoTM2_004346 [Fusarium oxysporum f. sp. vasinfectum]
MSQQPPIRPEQGSYTEFQLETSHLKPPHKRDKDILAKLRDSVPQNETQWQQARQLHRYATAEHVFQKTKDILENRIAKQDLRNFMSIATCCVYWHLNRKKDAYDYFKLQIGQATELTIQSYRDICQALGITVLDEEAYANFVSVLDSGRPVPYILPLPEQVAPAAPSSHDTLALRDGFASLFKAFDTSETLQKLVEEVRDVVDHQRRWEVPNTPLLELQWTLHYDVVVDQLVGHLIQQGILPRQPFHRYKSFYQHESGSISVSPGWVKIILPALVDDACQVSIAGPMLEEQDFIWDYKMGFILCESMRLSTPHTIFYFSVSIPITSDA